MKVIKKPAINNLNNAILTVLCFIKNRKNCNTNC